MEINLLKKPYEVSLSGNPIPFIFALSPYGNAEHAQDIRLQITVLVEQSFGSGIFSIARQQNFYPTADGIFSMEVQTILDPYLEYYVPRPALQRPVQAISQRKRFKINYVLQQNGALVGSSTDSSIFYVVKSGLSYEQWHPSEFFSSVIVSQKKPLLFSAAGEKFSIDETKYLFWIYPYADNANQTVTYTVYLSDGTTATKTSSTVFGGKWSVFCTPSGFSQSGLDAIVPADKYPVKWSLKITAGAVVVVNEYFFNIDNRNFYNTYQLLYRNSIGGLESLRLTGQVDIAADYDRQLAQRTLPPSWYSNMNLLPQQLDDTAEESMNFTGDTGFISKEACDKIRDLFLSKEKWELKNAKLLPVNITLKKSKFYSNKDSLISTSIEWSPAYSNEFYTPESLMPVSRSCPTVESFVVRQISRSNLQIMYSLATPYDMIEVQIIIGSITYTYTYTGNTKTVTQSFANPATTTPVDITIKGRTVCDNNSNPVDYGAFSIITLSVIGNSPPVAVDDYYDIPTGYNTAVALTPSALANDYDPDGDPFGALAASGATNAGGSYSIDAAGNISYTPPSSSYSGQDYFDYQIEETGGGDIITGRAYINVGTGAANVYAKLVYRNEVTYNNDYGYNTSGEVWVDFFSNPAGTIPYDISALSLMININDHYGYKNYTDPDEVFTDEDYSSTGTGNKMMVYSGTLSYQNYDESRGGTEMEDHDFTILAGSGYVVI
jgi:hypothetical protein